MNSRRMLVAALILLILVALDLQVVQAKEGHLAMENASLKAPSNETELVSFVESALSHIKEVGKEKAIKDFMDLNGSWVRGDVYIFAHAFNGTTLVLPYTPSGVGTNRLDIQDSEGRYINREMSCLAQNGGGFYYYVYRNPINNSIQNKVSFVKKVDDSWYLGAGIYAKDKPLMKSNEASAEIIPVDRGLMWRFVQVSDAVNANLSKIDSNLTAACLSLSKTGLNGKDAEKILSNLTQTDSSVVDCITINRNGTIVEVEPAEFQSVKGVNIGSQKHITDLLASKLPTGFSSIKSVEGIYAVDNAKPIFNSKGEFIGASTVMINATKFFDRVLGPYQTGGKAKFWVMDGKGMILYETDSSQIGKTMDDPIFKQFPEILAIVKRMTTERSGNGTYEFFDNTHQKEIEKWVFWTTVGKQGEEFKLMLTVDLE